MKTIAFATATTLMLAVSPAALAAEDACTDAMLEDRQTALMAFMEANPDKAPAVMEIIGKIEAEHGGEPPREKQCAAMDQVLTEAKAL